MSNAPIVIAPGFTPDDVLAVEKGLAIARAENRRVVLCASLPEMRSTRPLFPERYSADIVALQEHRARIEGYLANLASNKSPSDNVDVSIHLELGSPHGAILK